MTESVADGHAMLIITSGYCEAVGCYDVVVGSANARIRQKYCIQVQ